MHRRSVRHRQHHLIAVDTGRHALVGRYASVHRVGAVALQAQQSQQTRGDGAPDRAATGAAVASRIGMPWTGPEMLYDPDTNIAIGTAYLRQLMDQYGGQPYFTIAGYNAGPAPLARWQTQRPGMDPDFWIETISYKETREYVARVLAFSVIYDWRLNGDAATVSDRLRGITDGKRKRFACPLAAPPKPVN